MCRGLHEAKLSLDKKLRSRFSVWVAVPSAHACRPCIPRSRLALIPIFTCVDVSTERTSIAQLSRYGLRSWHACTNLPGRSVPSFLRLASRRKTGRGTCLLKPRKCRARSTCRFGGTELPCGRRWSGVASSVEPNTKGAAEEDAMAELASSPQVLLTCSRAQVLHVGSVPGRMDSRGAAGQLLVPRQPCSYLELVSPTTLGPSPTSVSSLLGERRAPFPFITLGVYTCLRTNSEDHTRGRLFSRLGALDHHIWRHVS